MVKKNKIIKKDNQRQNQQVHFHPVSSKKRKKNTGSRQVINSPRSQITKQRNRQNAQLDRYKRRILGQYTRCLPVLVKENHNIDQKVYKKMAMDKALGKFINFHNTHIVEKGETFTVNSIHPQLRIRFESFVNNLLSYSLEQLSSLDEKQLLRHGGNAEKEDDCDKDEEKQSTGDFAMINQGKQIDCSGLIVTRQPEKLIRISSSSNQKFIYKIFTIFLIAGVCCLMIGDQQRKQSSRLLLYQMVESDVGYEQPLRISKMQKMQEYNQINEDQENRNGKQNQPGQIHHLKKQQPPKQVNQSIAFLFNKTNIPEPIVPQHLHFRFSQLFVAMSGIGLIMVLFICICNLEKSWRKLKKSIKKRIKQQVMV